MKKIMYYLIMCIGAVASFMGTGTQDAQAAVTLTTPEPLQSQAPHQLYFADVLNAQGGGSLVAAHYSHRSHSSHGSHSSHYSSRY